MSKGSNVNTLRSDFIPPFIALLTAAGWENDVEFPLLSNALKLLIQKGGANHLRWGSFHHTQKTYFERR